VPSAFVAVDALVLTPSGKVDHNRLPAPSEGRPEKDDAYAPPRSALERQLAEILAAVIGLDRVGIDENFFEIGGDSILAIQVVAQAHEAGLRLSPLDLFAHPTVAALAGVVTAGPAIDAEQSDVSGPVPLTPGQRWFATAAIADPHHWNRSVVLAAPPGTQPRQVEDAVAQLMAHHDGLRQRHLLAGGRSRARIAPRGDATPFTVVDLIGLDDAEQGRRIAQFGAELQGSLDPAVGPLVRFALLRFGDGQPDRLAIVAHRLVADSGSMRILAEDLRTALGQLAAGQKVALAPKTTSWQSWARRLVDYAAGPMVQSQRTYWSELVAGPSRQLPADHIADPVTDIAVTERTVTVSLGPSATQELLTVAGTSPGRVEEILIAALSRTLCGWGGAGRYLIDVERPGRNALSEEVDVSRTVGWFSRTHPVALTGDPGDPPAAALKAVKETMRSVPADGIGWSLLRAGADPVPPAPVELVFRHLGELDSQGSPGSAAVAPPIGPDVSSNGRRPYPVEVETFLAGGALAVRWSYSDRRYEAGTVQGLAGRYLDELRTLIGTARDAVDPIYTPSDFPLAGVDQAQLDELLSRL
jgi:non-ribosomal peptide synthase protein (TIGR01720 family)